MSKLRKERLKMLRQWIGEDSALWDILTAMRGPDRGADQPHSERPCDSGDEHGRLYRARVARKMTTVAVLRYHALGSICGARTSSADHVVLPVESQWDHFDKHVARAANALGVRIEQV